MALDTEDLLHRLQQWLTQTNQELELAPESSSAVPAATPAPPVGLLQLIEAFTALRHELKLQTKSARGLEESLSSALGGLDRAIEQFRSVEPQETAAAEKAARPMVESLIELDEALRRGERAVSSAQRRLEETPQRLAEGLQQRFAELSPWRRWRAGPWQAELLPLCRQLVAETQSPVLSTLAEGYQLISARLQRMLSEHRIERLTCLGQRVDPTRMKVVELVDAPDVAPETVVEELRPGYVWRGQVVRYAEVRAARAAPQVSDAEQPALTEQAGSFCVSHESGIEKENETDQEEGRKR